MSYWKCITASRTKKIFSFGGYRFFCRRTATTSNVNPNPDDLSLSTNSRIIIYNCQLFSGRVTIMLHLALGGQNDEAHFWLDNIIERGVSFDVIGLSYYPQWHGSLEDLQNNLNELAKHYKKDLIVVEYSAYKQQVNQIAFNVADGKGKGTCIWEPLSTWEKIFDNEGNANKEYLQTYDELSKMYLSSK